MKYTTEQLEMIALHFNLFVDQDDNGNVVGNTDPKAETGWLPIYADACRKAIDAQTKRYYITHTRTHTANVTNCKDIGKRKRQSRQ